MVLLLRVAARLRCLGWGRRHLGLSVTLLLRAAAHPLPFPILFLPVCLPRGRRQL